MRRSHRRRLRWQISANEYCCSTTSQPALAVGPEAAQLCRLVPGFEWQPRTRRQRRAARTTFA